MAYRIIEQDCGLYSVDGEPQYRVVIQVDTQSDIPTPKTEWMEGSYCMIADEHKYKVLNSEREWV